MSEGKSGLDEAALLVVDMQNETLHPDGRLAGGLEDHLGELLDSVRRLVAWARAHAVPVIWLRLAFRPGHLDAVYNSMSRERGTFLDGEWGADIVDGLGKEAGDIVVTKRRPSGFFDTDLNIVCRGLGVRRLLVAGVSTHWAVESTVRDGHSHDYEMVVVRQAVASPFPEYHEPSLRVMASVFATVVDIDDVVAAS